MFHLNDIATTLPEIILASGAMFSPRKGRMYIGHVGDSRVCRMR